MGSRLSKQQMAARRVKALDMRSAGRSFQEVAAECGYSSVGHASKDVSRAMESVVMESGRNLLTLERIRTDAAQAEAWDLAVDPSVPPRTRVAAIREVTRLLERRARLLGIDKAAGELMTADSLEAAKGLLGAFALQAQQAVRQHDALTD